MVGHSQAVAGLAVTERNRAAVEHNLVAVEAGPVEHSQTVVEVAAVEQAEQDRCKQLEPAVVRAKQVAHGLFEAVAQVVA